MFTIDVLLISAPHFHKIELFINFTNEMQSVTDCIKKKTLQMYIKDILNIPHLHVANEINLIKTVLAYTGAMCIE